MTQTIAVIDYGMGNLRSVVKALEFVSDHAANIQLTSDPDTVRQADRIVFPGQGAAKDCMRALSETGLAEIVTEVSAQKPFLGICMGMQVLMTSSEENQGTPCLDIYPGQVRHFSERMNNERLKIPHMGWNTIAELQAHPLFDRIPDNSHFYFVHSYYVDPVDTTLTLGQTHYGVDFSAAIGRDNIFAMQCHPEKSAQAGLQLLANFIQWDGQA